MKELTKMQGKCLEAIKEYMKREGVCPSIRELMEELHYASTSSIQILLNSLEDKGYIERIGTRAIKVRGMKYIEEVEE